MEHDLEKHKQRSEKRKQGYDRKQAKATHEKGLLVVNTGTGKGKSTAAFGMALRAVGHGMNVGIVQFIKGAMGTAERDLLSAYEQVEFYVSGKGFTWHTQNLTQDIETAELGWTQAERMILHDPKQMVILDELNTVIKYGYLKLDRVLDVLKARPAAMHVIVTGRHAHAELIEAADLVSEIRPIKHPYQTQGIKAQPGIEF